MAAIEYNFFQTRLLVLLNFNKEKVHFFPPLYSKTRELKSLGQKNKSCLAISGLKVTINLKLVVNYNVFINLFYVGFLVSVLANTPSSHEDMMRNGQKFFETWQALNLVYNIFILFETNSVKVLNRIKILIGKLSLWGVIFAHSGCRKYIMHY